MSDVLGYRICEVLPCIGPPFDCDDDRTVPLCCDGCNRDGTRGTDTGITVERRPTPNYLAGEVLWREVPDA